MSKIGERFRNASNQLGNGVTKAKNAVKSAASKATPAGDAAATKPAKDRVPFKETVIGDRYNKAFAAGMETLGRGADAKPRVVLQERKATSLAAATGKQQDTALRAALGLNKQAFATLLGSGEGGYRGKDPQAASKMLERTRQAFGAAGSKLLGTQGLLDELAAGKPQAQVEREAMAKLSTLQADAAARGKAPSAAQVAAYAALVRGLLGQAVVQTSSQRTLTGQPKYQVSFVQNAAEQLDSLKELKRNPLGRSLGKKATRLQANAGQVGPQLDKGATHAKHAARMAGDYAHEGAAKVGAGVYVAGKALKEAGKAPLVAAQGFLGAVRKAGSAFNAEVRDFAGKHDQFARAPGAQAAGASASVRAARRDDDSASMRSVRTTASSQRPASAADADVTLAPQPTSRARNGATRINFDLDARAEANAPNRAAFDANYREALQSTSPAIARDFSQAKLYAEYAALGGNEGARQFFRLTTKENLDSALRQADVSEPVRARALAYVDNYVAVMVAEARA